VGEPDYYDRNGVMSVDWKIDDLGLHNDRLIQLKTNDFKQGLFFISSIIRSEVIEKYIEDIKKNTQIYALGCD
jgi:hypothetical protein